MNKVILKGRATADPEIRQGQETKVARYCLAVDGYGKESQADFINCVAFGKAADFAEKYINKGKEILILGRIKTGSYTNKDGVKIKTTDVIVELHEFCGSKSDNGAKTESNGTEYASPDGFMNIPEGMEELPFV